MNNQIAEIPFHGQTIQTAEIGGKPYVAFRPVVESIGMDFASQYRRLNGRSWATIVKMTTVGADGKSREMTAIDVRTVPTRRSKH